MLSNISGCYGPHYALSKQFNKFNIVPDPHAVSSATCRVLVPPDRCRTSLGHLRSKKNAAEIVQWVATQATTVELYTLLPPL